MKNTITISSDCVCTCIDSVADDTNRIFVALNLGEVTNPVLKIGLNGAEQSTQTLTSGKLNTVEIPGALFVAGGVVSFQYLDAAYTGNVFTITFPAKLEGNLSVKMQSEYAFSAKYTVIGGGGGGGSYTLLPATTENLGGVIVGSGLTVEQSGKISVKVDAALSETSENPVQNKLITARMNEVFQSVSDGKTLIASALTDKGFVISADATFAEFAQCIEDMNRNKTLVQSQTFSNADDAAAYVFSSSWFGSYARYDWKAFDGNNNTQWCCKQTDSMLGEYVGYDFQENIYPLTFEVYINNSNGSNPVFVFQGLNSNDEWVDLTEVTSLTTNGKVTVTKDIDTAISYRKYRLYFLSGIQSTSKGADVYEVRIKGFKYA